MFIALFKGDIKAAFASNPFLLCTSPIVLYFAGKAFLFFWREKQWVLGKIEQRILAVYLIGLLCFGVLRNTI
jgi:hypothetical protein